MSNRFAVVTCCTPNWLPFAATALLTVQRKIKEGVADSYVIVLDPSEQDRSKFDQFCALHGVTAQVVAVPADAPAASLSVNSQGPGTLLRLSMPDYLPHSYERVLYIDSDILAFGSVEPLFSIDMKGAMIGAVEDWLSFPAERRLPGPIMHFENIGLPQTARYFNAGMLLLDWQKLLKSNLFETCRGLADAAQQQHKTIKYADQDLLNAALAGDFLRLDARYNLTEPNLYFRKAAAVLRHFATPVKPWHDIWSFAQRRERKIYRQLLCGAPYHLPLRTRFTWYSFNSITEALVCKLNWKMRAELDWHAAQVSGAISSTGAHLMTTSSSVSETAG